MCRINTVHYPLALSCTDGIYFTNNYQLALAEDGHAIEHFTNYQLAPITAMYLNIYFTNYQFYYSMYVYTLSVSHIPSVFHVATEIIINHI